MATNNSHGNHGPADWVGGLISHVAVSLVQTALVFGTAYVTGFRRLGATDMDKTVNMTAAFVSVRAILFKIF